MISESFQTGEGIVTQTKYSIKGGESYSTAKVQLVYSTALPPPGKINIFVNLIDFVLCIST